MLPSIRSTLQQWLAATITAQHLEYALDQGVRTLQREGGLQVDGILGPHTRALIDARMNAKDAGNARLPRGKGVFVRSLAAAGSPKKILARMQQCGLSWIAVQRSWQYEGNEPTNYYNEATLQPLAEQIHAAGHRLWLWGFPVPGKHDAFAADLVAAAVGARATGIIIDPERPYIGRPGEAESLMKAVTAAAYGADLALGVTSYGLPGNFSDFPWHAFVGADFGIPQIYDAHRGMDPDYPTRAVMQWRTLGFRALVPATAGFNRTAAEMTELLAATPTPAEAIIWWDWWNLSRKPERWEAVERYLPLPGPA